MITDLEWAIYSSLAPKGSQLFSLGNGADGAYNPGASGNLDEYKVYQFTSLNIASGIIITRGTQADPRIDKSPLIILVQGSATIVGSINLLGKGYRGTNTEATPGSGLP